MKTIEVTGKSVEDAINSGLQQLKVTREKVDIHILDEGSKGIFNLIGTRPAKIRVTIKRDYCNDAKAFLKSILENMNIEAKIFIEEKGDTINIKLDGNNMGLLIGYRGETLDSLQYLVNLVINKDLDNHYKKVVLDIQNYRLKREETLKRLANKLAHKVKISGKSVKLEPMNPYERRIIHFQLQNNSYVETYSEGEEPYRRVVISLKKA